jgi:hypothetical protein
MSTTLTESVLSAATPAVPAPSVTATNTVLDDLVDAVQNYPHTNLTIDIFSIGTVNGGDQINEGDEVAFHVRVNNSGPLDVLDLVLTIEAGPGATGVKVHDGKSFSTDPINTDPITKVPGHQAAGDWTELSTDYHFLAGPATKSAVELVTVSVGTWDAGTDHIFVGHSRADSQAKDSYSHKVLGT